MVEDDIKQIDASKFKWEYLITLTPEQLEIVKSNIAPLYLQIHEMYFEIEEHFREVCQVIQFKKWQEANKTKPPAEKIEMPSSLEELAKLMKAAGIKVEDLK